jgi:hypothetical protein
MAPLQYKAVNRVPYDSCVPLKAVRRTRPLVVCSMAEQSLPSSSPALKFEVHSLVSPYYASYRFDLIHRIQWRELCGVFSFPICFQCGERE